MVIFVRVALLRTVLALGLLVPAGAGVAGAAGRDPSPAQIRRAISRAESSRQLWATVNVCDTRSYPNSIGVRGQMPGLGFPAWLSMRIQIYYYDKSRKRFLPDPKRGATQLVRLGRSSTLLQQGGKIFQFSAHTGYLSAKIQFIWRRSGKLLGETTRRTTAGHRGADFGDPKHYSAKQCKIR
jgi:hypothetical protein